MEIRVGYCCICLGINETLRTKEHVKVSRGLKSATFKAKGLTYVSELIVQNLQDTLKVYEYNIRNGIYVYRMASDSCPWMSEYEFEDLPNFSKIERLYKGLGDFVIREGMRVSFHPGPFNVLGSENDKVVNSTIRELNQHARIFDIMGLPMTVEYPINIHINTTKPDKESSMSRFVKNFESLSNSAKARLTVENDDKLSQYSVHDLYNGIHKRISIPIVFDQHHYIYGPDTNLYSMEESLKLAISTWPSGITPITHMSSSRTIEDKSAKLTAHADYIYDEIQNFGQKIDVEIEAKAKDLAAIRYKKDYMNQ